MDSPETKFAVTNKLILYALPIIGSIGLILPLSIGQYNLSMLGLYLGVPLILGPIIYITCLKKNQKVSKNLNINNHLFSLLLIIYTFCFSITIILLRTHEVRPHLYYLIITLMATSVLLEILLFNASRKKSIIVLVQLMILILDIVWGTTLNYNYFSGRTDVFGHSWMIENLISYGFINEVFEIYQSFPLWHILCSIVYMMIGISAPVHKIMFFTNGLIYSFMIPLI